MTTVLIVDDEALAIQAIRRSVNWENLDVDRVLDAANGVEAQKILSQEPVQVLVCDLEMPRMSGIELLDWMKDHCPNTKAVILTCHESFAMAQKAMGLGCVEYVLKPIAPTELTASIRHALTLWEEQEAMRDTSQAYEKGRSLRRDQYLQDILEKNILSTTESLFNCAQKYDLELDLGEFLQVVWFRIPMSAALPQGEQERIGYGVCNIARELWDVRSRGWTSLQHLNDKSFLLISAGMESAAAEAFGQELTSTCQTLLKQPVQVLIAAPCRILGLCSAVEALEQQAAGIGSPQEGGISREQHWRELILQEKTQTVQSEITTEMNGLSAPAARERMKKIVPDLCSALGLALQDRDCPEAGDLPAGPEDSFETIPQFLSWVQGSLMRAEQALRHSPGEDRVIRQIREYIELNIHQELTRESIAAAVYLNPDYTARLFKRKTGQSLNDYIQNKRISLARQLLAGTDMPVGDLAVALGYSSFSHFTKLFKSIEGVTPSDYRKQHARMPG